MTISFIRQIEDALYQVDRLTERAKKDNSEFQWRIDSARLSLQSIANTYHECLHRDSTEDSTYTPPLKEIK